MSYTKTHDLKVKVGTYTKGGQEKGRYENVGHILTSDRGEKMHCLKRTFNPAGVPDDGRDTIVLSVFEVNDSSSNAPASRQVPAQAPASEPELSDDIPF